jgi:hypothetical protein
LEAALATNARGVVPPGDELPCVTLRGRRIYTAAGLEVVGTPGYYAVLSTKKGGACRIFDRTTGQLAYEDASYVVEAGGTRWTAQLDGEEISGDLQRVSTKARFIESRQEQVTPARFVVLRLLNLTVFRSLTLGAWVRRLIVRRLISERRYGPFTLSRTVTFGPADVTFDDEISTTEGAAQVTRVQLPRMHSSIHMGSARYFHASELQILPSPDVAGIAEELNRGGRSTRHFVLRFTSGAAQPIGEKSDVAALPASVTK